MHVFWFCSRARKVWKATGLWSIISSFKGGSFADLFCWMEDHGRTDEFQFFLLLCWSLWIDRNTMVFKGITKPASETIDRCHILLKSYHLKPHNILDHKINQPSMDSWQPPPDGVLKINVDASVQASFDHRGIGIVGRDMRGHVFFAEGMTIPGKFSPLYAELLAIIKGILWALKYGGLHGLLNQMLWQRYKLYQRTILSLWRHRY